MVNVTLDLYSGRPNPTFDLPMAEAEALLAAIATAPRSIWTGVAASILGFRGVVLTLDATTARRHGLPTRFRLGDGAALDIAASAALAERVLRSTPAILGIPPGILVPWTEPPAFIETVPEAPVPETTGQSDVGPESTTTVKDGSCSFEIGRFAPAFWNAPAYVRENNNCYAYGCNMRTSTFPQPGRYAGQKLEHTLASVTACALADGLVRQGNCMPSARKPRWLVALVATPDNPSDWDYHWYRKQQDGYWGHKPGQTLATSRDRSGQLITDPQSCDRGRYTEWGGYFYVPQTADIKLT
jgi:hypothetical protein